MIDRHHVLFTRSHWTSTKEAKALRESFLFPLDREVHEELHRNCPPVPLLGYYALTSVLRNIEPVNKPKHDLEELMSAIELSTKHYKTHPIERQMGELAVEAVHLQLPFIIGDSSTIIDLQSKRGA